MVYITSDTHFNHANILKYCPNTRKYSSVDEMNEHMVTEWNNVVQPDDTVYHLGDVGFGLAKTIEVVSQLNGKKILIKGNHDTRFLKTQEFASLFEEVYEYYTFKYKNVDIVMFHYPILNWDRMRYGSIHFHGHTHGTINSVPNLRRMDVGVDATGNVVTLLNEAVSKMTAIDYRSGF